MAETSGTSYLRSALRFWLRTVLILITVIACYSAWRFRIPDERPVVEHIRQVGGQVFYQYQTPMPSMPATNFAAGPRDFVFASVDITVDELAEVDTPTLYEAIMGRDEAKRVAAVRMNWDQLTPEMVAQLKTLRKLSIVVVDMPNMVLNMDSDDGKRLQAVQNEMPNKVFPAFGPDIFSYP